MTLHEPATFATDCLLALLAGGLAWRLRPANAAAAYFRMTLWLTAASALVGGAYHGFAPNFSAAIAQLWWITTLLIICVMSATMAMSLLNELLPPDRQQNWRRAIGFKFLAFAGAVIAHPGFAIAIIDYGLVLVAWLVAALALHRAWRRWMLAGIALSVVAAIVQVARWAPSPRFNHNDLYHVIQGAALVGFYQAVRRLAGPQQSTLSAHV